MDWRNLWVLGLWLVPAVALGSESIVCKIHITSPMDGQSAVPLDAAISGTTSCAGEKAPTFVDDSGVAVPAKFTATSTTVRLQPLSPLLPNRSYTLEFAGHNCDERHGLTTFSTATRPTIRRLDFLTKAGDLLAVDLELSEPVLSLADLAPDSTGLTASVDGYAFSPALVAPKPSATSVRLDFQGHTQRPKTGQPLRVRAHAGLHFASGVTLDHDVDVTVVPAEFPHGWLVTGKVNHCNDTISCCICQSSPTGDPKGVIPLCVAAILLASCRRKLLG